MPPVPTRLEPEPAALGEALRQWFGFTAFRPGQEATVASWLRGEDGLVVRPTGSGKSLCYQLPALLLPPLTVVISPLIALMRDQVEALCARQPGVATCINSSLPVEVQRERLRQAVEGRVKLLYVAPERFRYGGFRRQLQAATIERFVVDEAHCVSEWGHDFRPDYLRLAEVLRELGDPPLLALTATATREVQTDILHQLGRPAAAVSVSGFNRPNLSFEVRCAVDEAMKLRHLAELLAELDGSGIIYASTRRETEAVARFVAERDSRPVVCYHAGCETEERDAGQDAFMAAPEAIVVATSAFGMGIDKPDVRFVIHYNLPGTVEAYYQQAGRAGRDGQPARCVLLYQSDDRGLQEWFIDQETVPAEWLERVLAALADGASLETLAERSRLTEIQTRVALGHLERLGALIERPDEPRRYDLARTRLTPAEAAEHDARIARRRGLRTQQLAAMVRYAELAHPRRTFLLSYFGDPSQPDPAELARDDPPPPPADPAVVTPEETELGRLILETVRAAGERAGLGRAKLVQVLKGSRAKNLGGHLQRLPGYGALARWRTEQLRAAVDDLLYGRLLKLVNGELPVVALTVWGRALLDDPRALIALPALRTMAPVLAAELPAKARPEAFAEAPTAAQERLLEDLGRWRTETARQRGCAPFMIFNNRTLELIARVAPTTVQELLTVPGVGPTKAELYGGEIIQHVERTRAGAPAPAPAPTEPLAGIWPGGGRWEDVNRLLDELARVIDPEALALLVDVDHAPSAPQLTRHFSRATGVPICYGLFDDQLRLVHPRRLAGPLLLVGREAALRLAAEQIAARGVGPIYGVSLTER